MLFILNCHLQQKWQVFSYLTTSTAPALTLGSRPVTETDAVKDPSMLKTTHSVFGGTMVRYNVELV